MALAINPIQMISVEAAAVQFEDFRTDIPSVALIIVTRLPALVANCRVMLVKTFIHANHLKPKHPHIRPTSTTRVSIEIKKLVTQPRSAD